MMRIDLTDNQPGKAYHRNVVAALFPIADKTIAELCRDNENLLIFPFSIETADDRVGDSSVMSIINTDNPDVVLQRGPVDEEAEPEHVEGEEVKE